MRETEVTPEAYNDNTPVRSMPGLYSGEYIKIDNESEVGRAVPFPLIEPCKELYRKNIRTIWSSANENHFFPDGQIIPAWIKFSTDGLSEENKKIAAEVSIPSNSHKFGGAHEELPNMATIEVEMTENSTAGEVKNNFLNIVNRFEKQATMS